VDKKYRNKRERKTTLKLGDVDVQFELAPKYGGGKLRWMFNREKDCIKDILHEIESSKVFWNVGANIGIYTCFVSKKTET
jgi:hypothetical protein